MAFKLPEWQHSQSTVVCRGGIGEIFDEEGCKDIEVKNRQIWRTTRKLDSMNWKIRR